jgi:hypothetical protein
MSAPNFSREKDTHLTSPKGFAKALLEILAAVEAPTPARRIAEVFIILEIIL